MQKYIATRPGFLIGLVFAWLLLLLVTTAQPVPANDAFFYDGAVVNLLLHGKYVNPTLALALPISGTQIFSAYPPLHQFVLLPWMFLFGTSVISAMAFHLALFGLYVVMLVAIFRRLQVFPWAANVSAAFLLILTFHDRPDSLAHLLGFSALYSWLRHQLALEAGAPGGQRWSWLMALFVVSGLCTSLQIGSVYLLLTVLLCTGAAVFLRSRFPAAAVAAMTLIPATLGTLVLFGFPTLWAGFLEHARQTPSFIGLHKPAVDDLLKLAKNAPGVLAVTLLFPVQLRKLASRNSFDTRRVAVIAGMTLLTSLVVIAACMFILTPNMVQIAAYLQPLLVGAYLTLTFGPTSAREALGQAKPPRDAWRTLHVASFLVLALIGSIRAIGMSTWGVACALGNSYASSTRQIRENLARFEEGQTVVISAAYLYDAVKLPGIRAIHSDWLQPARNRKETDAGVVIAVKPAELIITQFDFYRRYQPVLLELQAQHPEVKFKVVNLAKIRAPDSIPPLRKVIQHVSWAPVIVEFEWESALTK